MSYTDKNIGRSKMKEQPSKPFIYKLKDKAVKENHLDDEAVSTRCIKDKAVTPEKLSDGVFDHVTDSLDEKYGNITNELYTMIRSLQVGGVALSNQFGDREDIGITQKSITKAIGRIWDELGRITGKTYMDFKLTVEPDFAYSEAPITVLVTADATDAISDFDHIELWVNDELVDKSSDIEVYTKRVTISSTSVIKVIGQILGKTIVKEHTVVKDDPFFMGGGQTYQDVMTEENLRVIEGTLEGDYDAVIKHTGEKLFVIIPISRKEEFRRCKMDMNGFEIPFNVSETDDFIICESLNTYQAGTYNIDIDINS